MILAGIVIAVVVFGIFFVMRSTKEMPTNLADFICEVKLQLGGLVALTEDIVMRPKNKVGEYCFRRIFDQMN
jgi:hypothetical protein